MSKTLDDIAEIVGFTATLKLSAVFGGAAIFVPKEVGPNHKVSKLIGHDAAQALAAWLAGSVVKIPASREFVMLRTAAAVTDMSARGFGPRAIAASLGLHPNTVANMQALAKRAGIEATSEALDQLQSCAAQLQPDLFAQPAHARGGAQKQVALKRRKRRSIGA